MSRTENYKSLGEWAARHAVLLVPIVISVNSFSMRCNTYNPLVCHSMFEQLPPTRVAAYWVTRLI